MKFLILRKKINISVVNKILKLSGNLRPCTTHKRVKDVSVMGNLIATAMKILEKWEN